MNALIFTGIVAGLALLTSILGPQVYLYLVAASGLTGFIAWIGIAVSHYRFRRAYKLQGHSLDELKYKAKWFPLGPILALVLCILVIVGQDLASFAKWDIQAILVTYMSIPLFLFCYFFYKIKHKTKLIPLEKVDLEKTVVVTDEK